MELPSVIPDTIVQVINALERDAVYQFEWKLSRNLENVSLFVKCKFPAKLMMSRTVLPFRETSEEEEEENPICQTTCQGFSWADFGAHYEPLSQLKKCVKFPNFQVKNPRIINKFLYICCGYVDHILKIFFF